MSRKTIGDLLFMVALPLVFFERCAERRRLQALKDFSIDCTIRIKTADERPVRALKYL
ncbi:hypothetical protein [Marinobacterium aestuariivivens]|uniref:Transposase DDE domain-containing protein n=1 Tax=Marinobacterium aestuariivivens TaxID=1698799 RepID=A0ABW2A8S9_9GAMM